MLAGLLTQRLVKGAVTLGLLIGLVACATPPSVLTEPVAQMIELVPLTTAADAAPASLPFSPLVTPLPDDAPRPSLLGGEVAREFERGGASWYGPGFQGRRTANGERYDMNAMTAAHRTLPFGTLVRVHSLVNGRDVEVRINDRGPYSGKRVIDVSRAAAEELGMLGMGFKEVVLLVPESTPDVAVSPPLPVSKPKRNVRRALPSKPH